MCFVQKHITLAQTEVDNCKIILWFKSNITFVFISKHILRCTYDISENNVIDTFYNLLFTYEQKIQPKNNWIVIFYLELFLI